MKRNDNNKIPHRIVEITKRDYGLEISGKAAEMSNELLKILGNASTGNIIKIANEIRDIITDARKEVEKRMNFNEYQELALRTANKEKFTDDEALLNAALGLNGEAGEVADVVKKTNFQGHKFDKEKIIKELGDILWYVSLGAYACHETLETVAQMNIDKLKSRYPNGFESDRSQHRKDGDI